MEVEHGVNRSVKYLESCESKLYERFLLECDEGDYYHADQVVRLLKRFDFI